MKIITIGGLPAAGKTYTSKFIAQHNNYLALEIEKLRWDFFYANPEENLYKYTQHLPILKNENIRDYYLRCTLYESELPLELMVKWHKKAMTFIGDKLCKIIDEIVLIRTEKDYMNFCSKYAKLINYMPKFELLDKRYIICSHAFINTISFLEDKRIRIDFVSDKNILIDRFKQREHITKREFDKNIEIYYESYEEVLKSSISTLLDTNHKNIIKRINNLIKKERMLWI